MSPLLIKISKDFATLWTTIDPIGNVALFAGLTAALTRKERRLTALRVRFTLLVSEETAAMGKLEGRRTNYEVNLRRKKAEIGE